MKKMKRSAMKEAQHALDGPRKGKAVSQWTREAFMTDGVLREGARGTSRGKVLCGKDCWRTRLWLI